jgi:gliding motility-associated-like protein
MKTLLKYRTTNKLLASIACTLFFTSSFSQEVFTVTTLKDTCCNLEDYLPGSYRWALRKAGQTSDPKGAIIKFNIPGPGPYVFHFFDNDLPKLTRKTFIDGLSQPGAYAGHPLIEMDGSDWKDSKGVNHTSTRTHVLFDMNEPGGSYSTISGLVIRDWYDQVNAVGAINANDGNGNYITVENCFIGTDVTGLIAHPNKVGIIMFGGPHDWIIRNNVISGNHDQGIRGWQATNTLVENNLIGVGADGKTKVGNYTGVEFQGGASNNVIKNNTISYNVGDGISFNQGAVNNTVGGNTITYNGEHGVDNLNGNTTNNIIGLDVNGVGSPNIIGYNGVAGVYVGEWFDDSDHSYKAGAANKITVRGNSIFCNGSKGINLSVGSSNKGNNGLAAPVINSLSTQDLMYGTAPAGTIIDLYYGDGCNACNSGNSQGKNYLGFVKADGSGKWTYTNNTGVYTCFSLIASATDAQGNTSEFATSCVPPKIGFRDTTVCAGIDLDMDAGTCWKTYKWSTGETTQKIKIKNAAGNYSVTVTDINNIPQTATFKVIVKPSPIVKLNDTTLCSGGSVSFDAGNPGLKYAWSTGATTQKISASTTGKYWVTVTNATGCKTSDTAEIKMGTPPLVNLGKDTAFCIGGNVVLNAGNFSSYVWSTGASSQKITVNSAGQYFVKVTNAAGCTNSDTINIKTNPLPVVHIVKDTATCENTSLTLDAGAGYKSYLWSTGAATEKINVNKSGKYIITVTDANGCKNKDSSNVVIHPLPKVSISGTGKTELAPICEGKSMTLSASGTAASYAWSTGETGKSITVKTSGDYIATATDANGCKSYDTVTVKVLPLEHADFSIADYCDYNASTLPLGLPNFTTGGTFSFNPQNNDATINAVNGKVSANKAGSYRIEYQTKGLCPDTAWDTLHVYVSPVIVTQPKDFSTCGGAVSFSVEAENTVLYQWQENKSGTFANVNDGGQYNGAHTKTIDITGVTEVMNAYKYRCILSSVNCADTTNIATLAVNNTTKVLTHPSPVNLCAGKNALFSITALGVKNYQWQVSTDNGSTYTPATGSSYSNSTSSELTVNSVTAQMDKYLFRCFVFGCAYNDSSKGAVLNIIPPVKIIAQPTDASACLGADTLFFLTAENATSYEWQVSSNGGSFTTLSEESVYSGTKTATLQIKNASVAMNNNQYRCVVSGSCDPVISEIKTLKVNSTVIALTGESPVCLGNSATLIASGASTYTWSTGESTSSISVTPNLTTRYVVSGSDKGCKSEPLNYTVTVVPKPFVNIGPDSLICPKAKITIGENSKINYSYWWTSLPEDPSYTATSSITVSPLESTKYILHGKNDACPDIATDSITLTIYETPTIFIPNAFTPNNDGTNDVFKIAGEGIMDFKGSIYNRWGELIFEWNDAADGWNGIAKNNLVQEDVYVYKINVKNLCDNKKAGENILGSVTVVR